MFWTGSKPSGCPGQRFIPLLHINLYLKRNPNKKLTKKIPNKTKIPLHIEEGQGICEY